MEDMESTLKELLRRCKKRAFSLELHDEEEEGEVGEAEGEESFDESEETKSTEEELPFQDILAENRRNYTAKDEFIFLFYNDSLKYFVKEWDGYFLRKRKRKVSKEFEENIEDENNCDAGEEMIDESVDNETIEGANDSQGDLTKDNSSKPHLAWKLFAPDEFANIRFFNNNTYSGRISRKMMEGEGIYRWNNGVQYKGQFEKNRPNGKGLLEWNNDCWYEGDFVDGFRHGKGMIVNREKHYMYTGQWHRGHKHGKGYCRYAENDTYDGDWVMDRMDGVGLRNYPSGGRYVGQWKNGLRHGVGTMVWSNRDIYRGEWRCGQMHGYGEYIWNGFFNKSLTWPQEACYIGNWRFGMRHGKGLLKLNTVGGAKYSGYWKDDKKHGYGMIIGNNGETIEADPLFLNDILVPLKESQNDPEKRSNSENDDDTEVIEDKQFLEEPDKLAEAPVTPILKPEQFPSLSYHIARLFVPEYTETPSVHSVPSGKCYVCKENKSCSCLAESTKEKKSENKGDSSAEEKSATQESGTPEKDATDANLLSKWAYEERWIRNCLTIHMPCLRGIYTVYAKLFSTEAPRCNLVMSRLCLWQLWRDCGINEKGLSLLEIDNHIVKNKSSLLEDPYNPFEKVDIWQFLHALLEVSWQLYTKRDDVEVEEMNGKLAGGLHRFLKRVVYPNAGKHVGNVHNKYRDLLPIYCVFELYRQTGYPLSARGLLRVTNVLKGRSEPKPRPSVSLSSITVPEHLLDGINSITIGERIAYLAKSQDFLSLPKTIHVPKTYEDELAHDLLAFRQLGATKMMDIMCKVCPLIKDADSSIIINIDYQLSFLEFYEIILDATKELLIQRKIIEKEAQQIQLQKEAALANNVQLDDQLSVTHSRSSTRKSTRNKRKLELELSK